MIPALYHWLMTVFSSSKTRKFATWMGALALAATTAISPAMAADDTGTIAPPTLQGGTEGGGVATRPITEDSVGIQMFGWNWNSIKAECPSNLGPAGIDWVLVLPPTDHIDGNAWWVHYQPTSYELNSDAGTREQFIDMVHTCAQAGVQIVVDAVLNHMAGGSGISFSKKPYGENLNFGDGLYTRGNFHMGLPVTDPNYCKGDIVNWDAVPERFNCNFPGLPDLATEQPYVQQKIAGYLNDLLTIGVAGFRFDAAKHIPPADIAAIQKLLIRPAYLVQEVPGSTAQANEYTPNGDVWAWDMMEKVTSMYGTPGLAATAVTYDMLDTPSYPDTAKSLSWVTNHDTEHHGGAVTYQQGKLYQLAFTWLLAEKYGKPMLYSGYAFSADSDQAPFLANGYIADAKCASDTGPVVKVVSKKNKKTKKVTKTTYPTVGVYKDGQFTCVQRWTSVKGMVAFHKYVSRADKSNVFAKKGVYGFGRSGKGFVLINSNTATYKADKIATGMAAGDYCDLISGGGTPVKPGGGCLGTKVTVAADGSVTYSVPAVTAIAFTAATKLP